MSEEDKISVRRDSHTQDQPATPQHCIPLSIETYKTIPMIDHIALWNLFEPFEKRENLMGRDLNINEYTSQRDVIGFRN